MKVSTRDPRHAAAPSPEWSALYDLVEDFADEVREKLTQTLRQGRSGWDDPSWTEDDIRAALAEAVAKGDPVDVAAYAAFLWNRLPELGVRRG